MPAPSIRRIAAAIAVLVGLAALLGPATAQFGPEGPIRIGFILPSAPADATEPWQREFAEQVLHGALKSYEEHSFNAQLLGLDFDVIFEVVTTPDEAVAAAGRMVEQGAFAIAGGYSIDEAIALGQWAAENQIIFLNIGVQSDLLRNEMCFATTFHLEASAGMYLDSLAGWYVRDGYRRWYIVRSDSDEGERLYERLRWSMEERHFGVREAGNAVFAEGTDTADLVTAFDRSGADLLVLLLDPGEQLEVFAALEAAGFADQVAGYPYPETQTREYFLALRAAAPSIDHYRAVLWEPTLDTSGAIEFNLRHRNRWDGETMDGPAWAAFEAIKVLNDSAIFGGSTDPVVLAAYMASPAAVYDLHKLLGASFRPWDHQLRQPLYLTYVDPENPDVFRSGLLVGQLPALYLPGTEPVERLDQIGDLAGQTRCQF